MKSQSIYISCAETITFIVDRIFVKLAGYQDKHKISDEFEFWPDQISHFGVTIFLFFVKFAGYQDKHKISDEFEFWPDQISHFGVTIFLFFVKFAGYQDRHKISYEFEF